MKAVIQRVSRAEVTIDNEIVGKINRGFLILLGIDLLDDHEDVKWLIKKIVALRIFSDSEGKMNLNIRNVNGSILVVSQFTLQASTKKGNRPSFINAARPEQAVPLYQRFVQELIDYGVHTEEGRFGADMQVYLINDGPVTIILDSKNKV